MLLLEHDAKEVLAQRGVPVPSGVLVALGDETDPPGPPPWIVKAQVPVSGRGKAGGIRPANDLAELVETVAGLRGHAIRGLRVEEIRVEAAVAGAVEAYIGLSIDAARARIIVMASAKGGVDIEENQGDILRAEALPTQEALSQAIATVMGEMPETLRTPLGAAGRMLAEAYLDLDATLIEINPLFVHPDGSWIAGDVRMGVDESALPRQPDLAALLDRRATAYPDATFKREQGYDLVVVDPEGEIGLVSTGAGLSMKLIDEMTARGARPYNFCDIRSGMMRGDPARLIEALRRVAAGPRIRVVLVSIFAGITDLTEFADLLVQAVRAVPELHAPLVVRLVGNGEAAADTLLRRETPELVLERDLDRAVETCIGLARA